MNNMDSVLTFNNVFEAIDAASLDATDEKPLVVGLSYTPSKGWTFETSFDEKTVKSACKAFPVMAAAQGIEITDPPMNIERAERKPLKHANGTISLHPEPPGRIRFDKDRRIVFIEQFESDDSATVSDCVTIPAHQWNGARNKIDALVNEG